MFNILRLTCAVLGFSHGLFRDETILLVNPRLYFFTSPSISTVLFIVAPNVWTTSSSLLLRLMTFFVFVTYPHAFCIIKIDI